MAFPWQTAKKKPGKMPESLQMPNYGHPGNGRQSIDSVAIDRDPNTHPDHIRAENLILPNALKSHKSLHL